MNIFTKSQTGLLAIGLFLSGPAYADSLQSHIAAYEPEDCAPVVDQVVAERKIIEKNILKLQYLTYYVTAGEDGEDFNYQAWFSFKNCKGNYVINMNSACQIISTWGTYDCTLDRIAMKDTPKE